MKLQGTLTVRLLYPRYLTLLADRPITSAIKAVSTVWSTSRNAPSVIMPISPRPRPILLMLRRYALAVNASLGTVPNHC